MQAKNSQSGGTLGLLPKRGEFTGPVLEQQEQSAEKHMAQTANRQ